MPADRVKWIDDHEHQTTLPDDGCDDPICYWWEDMRPREVRELVHYTYECADWAGGSSSMLSPTPCGASERW